MKHVLGLTAMLLLTGGVSAHGGRFSQSASPTMTGRWSLARGNGMAAIVLDVALDGSKASCTIDRAPCVGEFVDGKLTFASPGTWAAWRNGSLGGDDAPSAIATVYFGTLKEDGTLSGWTDVFLRGYGAQAIKRMSWTGTRAK